MSGKPGLVTLTQVKVKLSTQNSERRKSANKPSEKPPEKVCEPPRQDPHFIGLY